MTDYNFDALDDLDATDADVETEVSEVNAMDVYAAFREEIQKKPDVEPHIVLGVRGRELFSIEFRVDNITIDKINVWRLSSRKKGRQGKTVFDPRSMALSVILDQTVAILFRGERILDDNGAPYTFRTKEVMDLLKSVDPRNAIATMFATDADILNAQNQILEAAGYGEDDDEDPLV